MTRAAAIFVGVLVLAVQQMLYRDQSCSFKLPHPDPLLILCNLKLKISALVR